MTPYQPLIVFLMSAAPVVELRGAIPLGIGVFSLPVPLVVVLSVLGNMLPVVAVYAVGGAWLSWTERRKGFFKRLTDRTVARSRRAFDGKRAIYGAWALPLFVAIPLPMTGAWTGAIAAFAFGVPFRKAAPLIAAGVCVAAAVVTLATTGALGAYGSLVTSV